MRHDRCALRLTGIEHEARAFRLCGEAHGAHTITSRSIEPSNLIAFDRRRVFTNAHGAINDEHEPVVRRRQVLLDGCAWLLVISTIVTGTWLRVGACTPPDEPL